MASSLRIWRVIVAGQMISLALGAIVLVILTAWDFGSVVPDYASQPAVILDVIPPTWYHNGQTIVQFEDGTTTAVDYRRGEKGAHILAPRYVGTKSTFGWFADKRK